MVSRGSGEGRRFRAHVALSLFLCALPVLGYGLQALDGDGLYWLGVLPRRSLGVAGIFTSVFLHVSVWHLLSNVLALFVLLFLLWHFHGDCAWRVLLLGWLGSGFGTWLIGRSSYHMGASGLVYAIAAYVVARGFWAGRRRLGAVGLVVIVLYGGLFWGIFPQSAGVSWEGHFCGAFVGVLLGLWGSRGAVVTRYGVGGPGTHAFSVARHTGSALSRVEWRLGEVWEEKG